MLGKILSSNGVIPLADDETEKEIILSDAVSYLNIIITNHCNLYINDSHDFIYLPLGYTQPFEIKGIPIWKFKIQKMESSIKPFQFSYYGFY